MTAPLPYLAFVMSMNLLSFPIDYPEILKMDQKLCDKLTAQKDIRFNDKLSFSKSKSWEAEAALKRSGNASE
jgi:hypothetical protein